MSATAGIQTGFEFVGCPVDGEIRETDGREHVILSSVKLAYWNFNFSGPKRAATRPNSCKVAGYSDLGGRYNYIREGDKYRFVGLVAG
jgi:hypothetical protein